MKNYGIEVNGKTIKVTAEDIDDIMCIALTGFITYWADAARPVGEFLGNELSEQISRGGTISIHEEEENTWHDFGLKEFLKGIELWEKEGMDRYNAVDEEGNINAGKIDSEMGDMIIQYGIFGELVYG